jgi:hypothetical protein
MRELLDLRELPTLFVQTTPHTYAKGIRPKTYFRRELTISASPSAARMIAS